MSEQIRPVNEVIEAMRAVMSWEPPAPPVQIDFKELASLLLSYHVRMENQEKAIEQLLERVNTL